MFISGLILYFKPEGTVARWLDWKILGVDKSGWESLHTVFSFLFLAFALFHILKVHLKNLTNYILTYKPPGFRRELFLSLGISFLFLIGTVLYLPPFHTIYQAGNVLSDRWAGLVHVEDETVEPRQSLEEIANEMGMDSTSLRRWMSGQGIRDLSSGATLMDHAEDLNITPYDLYRSMREAVSQGSNGKTSETYRTITLEEMALLFELEVEEIQEYLSERFGLDRVPPETSLYEISLRAQQTPREVKLQIFDKLQ